MVDSNDEQSDDRFEEIYEKLMKVIEDKQFPQNIEGNDRLDEIIHNLRDFTYIPFHRKLLEGIKKALYSEDPYVGKFPIKGVLSKRGISVLVNILAESKKEEIDDFVVDDYSPYVAVYHKRRNRTVLLLPTAIVGVDADVTTLMSSLRKWERKIDKNVERRYGEIEAFDKAFGYGVVFFASKRGSTIYEIIDNIAREKWRKEKLFEIMSALVKTDGKDSIVIIPPEEITNYMLKKISTQFGIKIERKVRRISLSQKVEEILRPYKEIIEAAEKYKSKSENDVVIVPSSIKNPQELSYHIMKFVVKKMGKEPRNTDLEWEYGYKLAIIPTHIDNLYITIMPKRLVLTKFKPDLFQAMLNLNEFVKGKFGTKEYFDSPRSGRIYFIPSVKQSDKVEIDVNVFGERLKVNAKIKDNTLWISRSSMIKFVIEVIKAQARGKSLS